MAAQEEESAGQCRSVLEASCPSSPRPPPALLSLQTPLLQEPHRACCFCTVLPAAGQQLPSSDPSPCCYGLSPLPLRVWHAEQGEISLCSMETGSVREGSSCWGWWEPLFSRCGAGGAWWCSTKAALTLGLCWCQCPLTRAAPVSPVLGRSCFLAQHGSAKGPIPTPDALRTHFANGTICCEAVSSLPSSPHLQWGFQAARSLGKGGGQSEGPLSPRHTAAPPPCSHPLIPPCLQRTQQHSVIFGAATQDVISAASSPPPPPPPLSPPPPPDK